jgi:isoleucyl-tRNA synthetase
MFKPFEGNVNYPEMEHRILRFWQERRIFDKLRAKNAGGPRWSFIDGPITANSPMGVHHGWGRTYKDIYCRFKAMQGYDQRWQNGFDCQGLWVEVEVEKALGFNSKTDIVNYGLDKFSRECRARVEQFAERITQQSIRLGQWMRWYDENGKPLSYFTMDDNNIEHIWYFLKKCEEKGWLYLGRRSMPWCWRCGTSLSQHELVDSYIEKVDPSVYFRCKVHGRENEYFLVWTTTPWTLTANTALAIQPDLDYVKARVNGDVYYLIAERAAAALPQGAEKLGTVKGSALIGLTYDGPMQDLPAQASVRRRTVPWDAISTEEGTGIVHIAPGCGAEDYELSKALGLDTLVPIDENGYFGEGFGWLEGRHVTESAELIRDDLQKKGVLFAWGDYTHRYPICWRCKTPLVFRLVDEWFISCEEIRPLMKREAAKVRWTPEYGGNLMQNWLDNMGDWCISRRRFWGLPLPIYICRCGHRTVVGSQAELKERAVNPETVDALPELHRPWIDQVKIQCPQCGSAVARIPEVGDCWLDAGIVPYSTLNYLPEHKGVAGALWSTRAPENFKGSGLRGQGSENTSPLSTLNPESEWSRWFPAAFISEMREQIRLWFYSLLFMSVTLEERTPYLQVQTYEEMRDEHGEPFSKTAGTSIPFDEAAEKMGADPMRWVYAAAPLNQIFRFGYGPANEVKRKMLTLWNCYKFFIEYANLDKPRLTLESLKVGKSERSDLPTCPPANELDRWILARLQQLIAACNDRLENFDSAAVTREVEKFIDDLSTWYVRQSRRRFWKSEDDSDKAAAYQTLYDVLVTLARLIAPILPFTAEEMYQNLVRSVFADAPESVHLCSYPTVNAALQNDSLIEDVATLRRIVSLALSARKEANVKVRQPLPRLLVKPADQHEREVLARMQAQILNELNVKALEFIEDESALQTVVIKPNLAKLGPKFGKRLPQIQQALLSTNAQAIGAKVAAGESVELGVNGESITLTPEDLIVERVPAAGLKVASDNGCIIALDTNLTTDLEREGKARDFVRYVQDLRKRANFNVSDRIIIYYVADGEAAAAMVRHADYIRQETLANALIAAPPPDGAFTTTFTLGGQPTQVGILRAQTE